MAPPPSGKLIVLSGPSGAGKSTLVVRLRADPRVVWSVSATTRPARSDERDGCHYHFVSRAEFERRIERGEFLEHNPVHGDLYGTPREPIERALAEGRLALLDIDVQGARSVRESGLPALFIFIQPPDMQELERRLAGRGSENPEVVRRRIERARAEMEERHRFDHVVTNDSLDRALREVVEIVERATGVRIAAGPARSCDPAGAAGGAPR